MAVKVAINGFGRIGRITFRALAARPDDFEIVGINDLADTQALANLLKYDSVHGRFNGSIEIDSDGEDMIVNGKLVKVCTERDPGNLPWGDLGVDVALESTGFFTNRMTDSKPGYDSHLKAGARKVVISAPAKDAPDLTVVMGVNDDKLSPEHKCISNASCTTNCLAPVAKVLNDAFGIKRGLVTTIHAYTNDQKILDLPHKDLRRARAAAMSMIPTTTGAAKAVGLVIPELNGKLNGMAMRVPTPDVSVVDLVAELDKSATAEDINAALKKAAEGELKGILGFCEEPLVSVDFTGNPLSSIVDAKSTMVLDNNFVKVLSWYDNEWGFSCRMVDLMVLIGKKCKL